MEKKGSSLISREIQARNRHAGRPKGRAMPPTARDAKTRHPGAAALVALLVVLVFAFLYVRNTVFVVKSVTIIGNRFCSREEVLACAGISAGDSLLAIDTKKVREGINANRYLRFLGISRELPSHVTLRVEEHAPRAMLTSIGVLVLIGEDGIVLEESVDIEMALHLRIPAITGVQAERTRAGYPVLYTQPGQAAAVEKILDVLESQGAVGEVSELNVGALDNLYLVTGDGLQVVLGSDKDMREKVALMMMLLPALREIAEVRGGVLDVTTGVSGDFRPSKRPR